MRFQNVFYSQWDVKDADFDFILCHMTSLKTFTYYILLIQKKFFDRVTGIVV